MLTKPDAASTAVRQAIRARGREILDQPLLWVHTPPSPAHSWHDVQALLATSARAFAGMTNGPANVPVFVAGASTARAAYAAGFVTVRTAPDALTLAPLVRSHCDPADGTLLYLAGRDRSRDLARMLEGYTVRVVETYAAMPVRRLQPDVHRAIAAGRVDAITLYSARSAIALAHACRDAGILPQAQRIPALCMSRRIAAQMLARGWRQAWSAPLPQGDYLTSRLIGRRVSPAISRSVDRTPASPIGAP